MTTPVESLQDSIRRTLALIKRDAPAARFIGEQVVKMAERSVLRRLNGRLFSGAHGQRTPLSSADSKSRDSSTEVASDEESLGSSSQIGMQPWPDYDVMSARDVIARLQSCTAEARATVKDYEQRHRRRSTIVASCNE